MLCFIMPCKVVQNVFFVFAMKSLSVTVEVLFGIVFVVCLKWFLSALAEILSCCYIRPLKLLKNLFSFLQGLCKILVTEMFIFDFDM